MKDYKAISDFELIEMVKNHDRAAYTEVYNRYTAELLLHAYHKTHDREKSRDFVHDLFTMLWSKREVLHIHTNLKGFLYTSLRNLILDSFLHDAVCDKYYNSLLAYLNKHTETTDYKIREQQLIEQIDKAISSLPERMQEVFNLSRNQFLSHKEIATKLGISEHTVHNHLTKAIAHMKSRLLTYFMIYYLMENAYPAIQAMSA